jgi:hypothetical protein
MARSVKRAISLRKEQDEQLQSLAEKRRTPYSRLVQDAIGLFLRMEEQNRIRQSYRRYYEDKRNADRERGAARDFCRLVRGGR